jgi:uncharacterized membrane protein
MASRTGVYGSVEPIVPALGQRSLAQFIDHWMFVIVAGLFLVTALTSFIPDSVRMLRPVDAGQHASVPAVLHLHAALMGTGLALLFVQSTLMAFTCEATGNPPWQRR